MLQWEKKVFNALIDALRPFGEVLEVGFSEEYPAEQIEKFHPKTLTILEPDPIKAKRAKKWAKQHANVLVVEDFWQNALPQLGIFDVIFFNAQQENLSDPTVKKMRCSEIEVERFCKEAAKSVFSEVGQFLYELEHSGQISSEFRKKMVKKYRLKVKAPPRSLDSEPLLSFLEKCLQNHMRKQSRFGCFLSDAISQYEDPQFFEKIIVDPFLEYREQTMRIKTAKELKEVLLITVEKL